MMKYVILPSFCLRKKYLMKKAAASRRTSGEITKKSTIYRVQGPEQYEITYSFVAGDEIIILITLKTFDAEPAAKR